MTIDPSVLAEIEGMKTATTAALREKYLIVFGQPSRSSNKQFLFRRIAWRLQALREGDVSERARRRAAELANDADLRIRAPRQFLNALQMARESTPPHRPQKRRDDRLPPSGTVLTKSFRGDRIEVEVLEDGFQFRSSRYRSLSAIAREVTGTRWNGLLFFGLTDRSHG